jgi:hypothetical protein
MILYNASERNMENLHRKNVVPMCTCTSCVHSYESAFEDTVNTFVLSYLLPSYFRTKVLYHSVYFRTRRYLRRYFRKYLRTFVSISVHVGPTVQRCTFVLPYRISISQYFRSVFYCTCTTVCCRASYTYTYHIFYNVVVVSIFVRRYRYVQQ